MTRQPAARHGGDGVAQLTRMVKSITGRDGISYEEGTPEWAAMTDCAQRGHLACGRWSQRKLDGAQDGAMSPTVTSAQDGHTDHGHAQ